MPPLGRLYPILDVQSFPTRAALFRAAEEMVKAGVGLLQYRNKIDDAQTILAQARELKSRLGRIRPRPLALILNDRADLCLAAGFEGVHVGQTDLSPVSVRQIIGRARYLGVSTHNPEQAQHAAQSTADYVAIGPVFPTTAKANPDPVVGLPGVRQARALTSKPLVAIGGITRE
ncbi:MAG: thiamine phosphate synthase, partial [Acidobacteria bacterium]|nr:thiamine phosphate synthase [Acidobacteriota bacterium]